MTESQRSNYEAQLPDEEEINLLDLLIVLAKHKKTIIGVTFAAALLAVVVSLLLPNIYTGTTRILPPQQSQSSASAMLSQLGGLAGLAGGALGIKDSSALYISMLKSHTLMEKIVQRFDLQRVYEQKTMTDTGEPIGKWCIQGTEMCLGRQGEDCGGGADPILMTFPSERRP